MIKKTLGTSKNPAITCADLFKANPYKKSGKRFNYNFFMHDFSFAIFQ